MRSMTLAPITTVVPAEVQQVTLTPALRRKLLAELRLYAELKTQMDALKHGMEKAKAKVEGVLGEVGESNLTVEGFKTQLIVPEHGKKTLNPKLLIAQGVTEAQLLKATEEATPSAPYLRIDVPK